MLGSRHGYTQRILDPINSFRYVHLARCYGPAGLFADGGQFNLNQKDAFLRTLHLFSPGSIHPPPFF